MALRYSRSIGRQQRGGSVAAMNNAGYNALKSSREGYFRIRKIKPSLGDEKEGWSYAFAENMPLHIDNPERWYSTSNVTKINWDEGTFETLNSVYSFEMVKNC